MKSILIIIFINVIFTNMYGHDTSRVYKLEQVVKKLSIEINNQRALNEKCCCENKIFFRDLHELWFDENSIFYQNLDLVNPNDRFPFPPCNYDGPKGILIMLDATLYFEFSNELGWLLIGSAHGGINF
jgi:hypothetical protein